MKALNVRPITELRNQTKALIGEIVESGQSVVITQNGKPQVVVMGAAEHDRMQDTLAMLKLLAHSVGSFARTGKVFSGADIRRRVKRTLDKTPRR
jgi:prevent-host-death family protein